eukprot:g41143.t1
MPALIPIFSISLAERFMQGALRREFLTHLYSQRLSRTVVSTSTRSAVVHQKLVQNSRNFSSAPEPKQEKPFLVSGFRREDWKDANAPISWKTVGFALVIGGLGISYLQYKRSTQVAMYSDQKTVGKVSLGGPFELVGMDGQPKTQKDFYGQFCLLYFGFTACPDICPARMQVVEKALAMAKEKLPKEAEVRLLFVSVDPKRDTPAVLRTYSKQWNPAWTFLTGSFQQVEKMAKLYRVYFSAPEGGDDDYQVDHTIFVYLLDTHGDFVNFYGKHLNAEEIAAKLTDDIQRSLQDKANAQASSKKA